MPSAAAAPTTAASERTTRETVGWLTLKNAQQRLGEVVAQGDHRHRDRHRKAQRATPPTWWLPAATPRGGTLDEQVKLIVGQAGHGLGATVPPVVSHGRWNGRAEPTERGCWTHTRPTAWGTYASVVLMLVR